MCFLIFFLIVVFVSFLKKERKKGCRVGVRRWGGSRAEFEEGEILNKIYYMKKEPFYLKA